MPQLEGAEATVAFACGPRELFLALALMTLAVAASTSAQLALSQTVPIVILGTDALLAASPATPVQLAHACLRAGFANVVPASWGDEIIAAAVLRRLPKFGSAPVIQCSCPIVAHRLLTVGGDLRSVMLPLVPPPVAVSRYVRALSEPGRLRITYVGGCPGAMDDSIDIRMTPEALIAMLSERHIALEDQPRMFESVIPPDRRRFRSQPGGVPTAEILWTESGARTLAEVEGDDFATEIAQLLLSGKNVLIDASARLGCVCSGATSSVPPSEARSHVVALEPPRATIPVVDEQAPIELDLHVPAASRTPIDVVAVPAGPLVPSAPSVAPVPRSADTSFGHRISPVRGFSTIPSDARPPRTGSPPTARPVVGVVPVVRDVGGKSLPRAYIARRRPSPKGVPAVRGADRLESTPVRGVFQGAMDQGSDDEGLSDDSTDQTLPLPQRLPVRYVVFILLAVAATIIVSSAIAVVVGRSLSAPAATSSPTP